MSEFRSGPVMRLDAEKLLGADGEYAVDFVAPGWLDACRRAGGTFLLYPQTFVDALAAQRDEGLAREAELQAELASAKDDKEPFGHNTVALRLRVNQLQQRLAEAEKRPAVNADALYTVLSALCGPMHHIRELQVCRGLPGSPIDQLQREFNAWIESTQAGASPGCADGEKAS